MERALALTEKNEIRKSLWGIAWQQGVAAAKHNVYPAVGLWLFGVGLVLCYFLVAPIHDWLEQVGEFKLRTGWPFAAVSTAIFAGVIPFFIPKLFGNGDSKQGLVYLVSNVLFWAYKGVEVDLFYVLQASMFGDGTDVATIGVKVAVDQLIYAPLLGLLTVILFYLWRDNGYSSVRFRQALGPQWYRNRVLPVLISNWFVWVPACVIVYCLPLGLQLPIQNLILCFWVLILAFFTERK